MKKQVFEPVFAVEISEEIEKKVKTVGVKGLDAEKAKELGVFMRIANLLSTIHTTICAAYQIYGDVDNLFGMLKARKNEINLEMNKFEKAYDRFIKFWNIYFVKNLDRKDIYGEIESMQYQIMKWMQIPLNWQLGEPQRCEDDTNVAIRVENDDNKVYSFKQTSIDNKVISEKESWCVVKFNEEKCEQHTVNVDLDKASALMIAKRLSDEDPSNMYTAALVRDVTEKYTEVTPFKAFKANNTVGKIIKTLK